MGLGVLVAIGLLAAGCGDTSSSGGGGGAGGATGTTATTEEPQLTPQSGGKLNYGLAAETDGWNPMKSRWAHSGLSVSMAIFDKLTAIDEQGNWKPYLAESFTPNADFTEWTIKLRPGVQFHDGTPVDAEAIKLNMEGWRDGLLTGGALSALKKGEGGVVVVDPRTVKVAMTQPWSTFPGALAAQTGSVAAPSMLNAPDGAPKNPIGSGPFRFDSWQVGTKLVVKKNPTYWQKGMPYLDSIEFRPITDNQTRSSALRAHDIDAMENFDPPTFESFKDEIARGDFRVLFNPKSEDDESSVMLNTSAEPFNDPVARRALVQATNKKAIIDIIGPSLEPANGPYPKGSRWFTDSDYPQFDLAAAKKDVEDYKARHGGKFEFELKGVPTIEIQNVEQQLQQQWKEAGITVTITNVEQPVLIIAAVTGDFQASMWRSFGFPSPDLEYPWWIGANAKGKGELALNMSRNKDPEIDKALDAARKLTNFAEQKAQYDIVQKRLAKDMPFVWLYHVQSMVIASPRIHDISRWNFPNSTEKGFGMIGVIHPWHQVWIG